MGQDRRRELELPHFVGHLRINRIDEGRPGRVRTIEVIQESKGATFLPLDGGGQVGGESEFGTIPSPNPSHKGRGTKSYSAWTRIVKLQSGLGIQVAPCTPRKTLESRSYPKTVIASEAWQSRSWNCSEKRQKTAPIPVAASVLG